MNSGACIGRPDGTFWYVKTKKDIELYNALVQQNFIELTYTDTILKALKHCKDESDTYQLIYQFIGNAFADGWLYGTHHKLEIPEEKSKKRSRKVNG